MNPLIPVIGTLSLVYLPLWIVLLSLLLLLAVRIFLNRRYAQSVAAKLAYVKQAVAKQPQCDFTRSYGDVDPSVARSIVLLDASTLAAQIAARSLSSRTVMLAYISHAQKAHKALNCLTCHRFEEALKEADECDRYLEEHGRTKGPLHGVPFSVKDGINLRGLDSTIGIMKYCFKPAVDDAVSVKVLRNAGAIPFTKTNVHQLVMGYECSNPVYGTCKNPWDPTRTPGGSSGGDAALIAAHGAPFGIGTDIGGSLRMPAHFTGLFTLKPTGNQISMKGCVTGVPGQEGIVSNLAPICRSAQDLDLILSIMIGSEVQRSHDPASIPSVYRRVVGDAAENVSHRGRKLRIGYYEDDGFFSPNPACARAVREAVAALEKDGHEVVKFTPPTLVDALHTYYALMVADGSAVQLQMLEGEEIDDTLKTLLRNRRMPPIAVRAVAAVYEKVFGWKRMSRVFTGCLPKTVAETWALQAAKKNYRALLLETWALEGLDALLCPVHSLPAITLGSSQKMLVNVSYTALFNLVDFPAAVVPITQVTEAEAQHKRECADMWDKVAASTEAGSAGLPVGVQVVTRPFEEEKCVSVADQIARLSPFHASPPDW
eukprot:TRINITY_DN2285_c0_g1_i1.p1 TRINITY_DN2285_c0_g1~~TRINITY_DN2285_c0_g1_i1.p1  ORF type:complete len:608 (-),score=159.66 TRINITY_DN2285_c0_g1_i1:189-1988(-)